MRVGLLAKKIGMTRIFDEFGVHQPATVLECPEALVVKVSHNAKDNVQIASFDAKDKGLNKAQIAEYKKLKSASKKHAAEFKVANGEDFKPGQIITLNHFVEGQYVDVRGRTIGKGFAGAMKRHGFGGLEATHGISISHRSHGSTGQCQDPGRVFKGKKMAGHMGDVNVTIQNLEVLKVDSENSLIFIKGAVPGSKGTIVTLTDAVKVSLPADAPFPAGFKVDEKKAAAEAAKEEATDQVEESAQGEAADNAEKQDS